MIISQMTAELVTYSKGYIWKEGFKKKSICRSVLVLQTCTNIVKIMVAF